MTEDEIKYIYEDEDEDEDEDDYPDYTGGVL